MQTFAKVPYLFTQDMEINRLKIKNLHREKPCASRNASDYSYLTIS